jgi:hypothetical protein
MTAYAAAISVTAATAILDSDADFAGLVATELLLDDDFK